LFLSRLSRRRRQFCCKLWECWREISEVLSNNSELFEHISLISSTAADLVLSSLLILYSILTLFLATPDPLGEFVVNLLYALGCLIGTTHFTTSPDPPQPKFAAEVGVLSGVSYEQPIGGKFSLVGKAGVTMLDQGNPWAYSGFQPAAELGLR